MTYLLNKINELKEERNKILNEIQEARKNNNDELFIKSLKNKYHSISNRINYIQDRENIKEKKRIHNALNITPERIEKMREYARKYQKNIKEMINKYKKDNKQINI